MCPRSVLVLRQYRKGSLFVRCEREAGSAEAAASVANPAAPKRPNGRPITKPMMLKTNTLSTYIPINWRRTAPTARMIPICLICCVKMAAMVLTTSPPLKKIVRMPITCNTNSRPLTWFCAQCWPGSEL